MKKIYLSLVSLLFITLTFGQVPTPTLYLTITSHNEPAEVYTTTTAFYPTRDTLRKIVDMIYAKNAKYNLQTFPGFLQGSMMFEQATTTTTDIVEYANKIGGVAGNVVEIDPRFKAGTTSFYNIADVSYSIGLTGAQPSKNVGGFIYLNTSPPPGTYTAGDWIPYTTSISAMNTPTYSWKADVIWGAGSIPPHSNDANNYGVWKPRGKTDSVDFYCHNPSQTVWLQGNGCGWLITPTTNVNAMIAEIRSEATKISNGTYPANKFYNGHVMIDFKNFGTSTITPTFQMRYELARVIDSINVMVSQGKIAWKTITQKHNAFLAWSSSTGISYSQWRCGQTTTLTPTCIQSGLSEQEFENQIALYPNPTYGQLNVNVNSSFNTEEVLVFNNIGQVCKRVQVNKKDAFLKIDVADLPKGVYLIRIDKRTTRFIKE